MGILNMLVGERKNPVMDRKAPPLEDPGLGVEAMMLQPAVVSLTGGLLLIRFEAERETLVCEVFFDKGVNSVKSRLNGNEVCLNMTEETHVLRTAVNSEVIRSEDRLMSALREKIDLNSGLLDEGLSI